MNMESINPASGERNEVFEYWDEAQLDAALAQASAAAPGWRASGFRQRAHRMRDLATELRAGRELYAGLITREMGKLHKEALAEVEKCAVGCEYAAEHGESFLKDSYVETEARSSLVTHEPLGTLLAIMPWNFPFWQAFRAAVPALMAGNTILLKHASNVPRCAFAIEEIFHRAGFAPGVFRTLAISGAQAEKVIADPRVHAVTLTGSEDTGRRVAAAAASNLKKSVLELGGSDPFIVLEDADLERAATAAVQARLQNCGQSCIAAKRFVLNERVADDFLALLSAKLRALRPGDPLDIQTTLAPMARADLRTALHRQVTDSVRAGARLTLDGGPTGGPGFFFDPVILDHVAPGMRAYEEELFGPVFIVLRVHDDDEAVRVANDNRYGLGGSVWTRHHERGERLARRLDCGSAFVNAIVRSDARLPFGGIKASGYGRELALYGMREFVNAKSLWIET